MSERLPDHWKIKFSDRWWAWRHRNHGGIRVKLHMSVCGMDPSARGVLLECKCGAFSAR